MATNEEFPGPGLRQKHVKQLMKTEMCKFFLNNRCGKGLRCPFAHSLTEVREKPNLNKTSMCKAFLQTGNCDRPGCTFAHDERELRTTTGFFKTKLCRFAASGRCKHGDTCRFAHQMTELKEAPLEPVGEEVAALLPPFHSNFGNSDAGSTSGMTPAFGVHGRAPEQWTDLMSDLSNRDLSSDQSTRAETSFSVPTPEGSGDSGQEESAWTQGSAGQRRGSGAMARNLRTGGDRMPSRHCTTLMLTNVPNFLTQGALVSLLEDLTVCVRGAFDFFYCPWDSYQDLNLGYAIINFFQRSVAAEFERQWANQPLLPGTQGTKRLRIVPAALQGRAANLRHFSGFSLARHSDPRFRPLVRAGPHEALRPMAVVEELSCAGTEPSEGGSGQSGGGMVAQAAGACRGAGSVQHGSPLGSMLHPPGKGPPQQQQERPRQQRQQQQHPQQQQQQEQQQWQQQPRLHQELQLLAGLQQLQQQIAQGGNYHNRNSHEELLGQMQMLAAGGIGGIGMQGLPPASMLEVPESPGSQNGLNSSFVIPDGGCWGRPAGQMPFAPSPQPTGFPEHGGGADYGRGGGAAAASTAADGPGVREMLEQLSQAHAQVAALARGPKAGAQDDAPAHPYWALVYSNGAAGPGQLESGAGAHSIAPDSLQPAARAASGAALGSMACAMPCYTNGLSSAGLAYIPQLSPLTSRDELQPYLD